MMVSTRGHYALQVMIDLAEQQSMPSPTWSKAHWSCSTVRYR